jgi:tripartite-type tricarboxylate transporter receptor subunit TctC
MEIQLRRRAVLGIAAACFISLLVCPPTASAQSYPNRPVKLIVPFPPGGAVDIYARTVLPALSENLGQPVVVENRTGASGMIGAEVVAKAAPDGYTLLVGNIATLAMNAAIYRKMPYDPLKDLSPITQSVIVNYVLVVHPDVPAGIAGPAGLPAPIVARLNDAFNRVQALPQVAQRLEEAGLTPAAGTPEAFAGYIRSEIALWTKVARDVGATVD